MAADPEYPLAAPSRVMADEEDRGNGLALIEWVRIAGSAPDPADVVTAQVLAPDNPGDMSPGGALVVRNMRAYFELSVLASGYSTALNYTPGDVVGIPLDVGLTGSAQYDLANVSVSLVDEEGVLDETTQVWYVWNPANTLVAPTIPANNDAFDLTGIGTAGAAVVAEVGMRPDGTRFIYPYGTGSAVKMAMAFPEMIRLVVGGVFVIVFGGAAADWSAANKVVLHVSGELMTAGGSA